MDGNYKVPTVLVGKDLGSHLAIPAIPNSVFLNEYHEFCPSSQRPKKMDEWNVNDL